jgi:hypothetical protein
MDDSRAARRVLEGNLALLTGGRNLSVRGVEQPARSSLGHAAWTTPIGGRPGEASGLPRSAPKDAGQFKVVCPDENYD